MAKWFPSFRMQSMSRPGKYANAHPQYSRCTFQTFAGGFCFARWGIPWRFYLGVLDRLLQEPWLQIDGISGTSAGAMNAAVLSDGYAEGGAEGGRAALEAFWQRVSKAAVMSPFRRGYMDILLGRWTMDSSPMFVAFDLASRLFLRTT